jgi:hypothetical protein
VLDQALACIEATWPNDTAILRREMLSGLVEFLKRFGKQVSVEMFTTRLRNKQPADMLFEYGQRTQGRGTRSNAFNASMRFVLCSIFVDAYNKGMPPGSKQRLKLVWENTGVSEPEATKKCE